MIPKASYLRIDDMPARVSTKVLSAVAKSVRALNLECFAGVGVVLRAVEVGVVLPVVPNT